MPRIPSGTITFLFTDIEGSTRLWESQAGTMRSSLARHDAIMRAAIEAHGGYVFKTVGDAFCAAFETAPDCLDASIDAQLALAAEPWEVKGGLRVRMAFHSGTAEEREGDYFGQTLNRVARLIGLAYGGQVLVSLVAEELLRDNLPDGIALLDVGEHRLKDLMRPERVFQVRHPALRSDFPVLKSLDAHPHNLPVQPTPFLGREAELAAVKSFLADEAVRILTLTGPGGTGKTRLSLQSAADSIERFEDGIYFVDLSAVDSPDYLIAVIARSLGLRESGGRRHIDLLRDFCGHRRMLLILDNFEQIAGGEPYIVQLLGLCPSLKLAVTSREALHIRGEQVFPVPPLSAPKVRQARRLEPEQLRQYEAVSLFIERARAIRPDFSATNENAPAIAEICARLDGLPLAIELAAARVLLLEPREILARLDKQLKLLSGGLADLPHRQRTLRATIEWSYRLLSPAEQGLLRELSVFAGGATLEAAERVCDCADADPGALETLSALVGKSLLAREDRAGEPHFVMLESIREYGLEELERAGTSLAMREAHARYFLAKAEETRRLLRGPTRKLALGIFEAGLDNFQAALDYSHESGSVDEELRLCNALGGFWSSRGYLSAGLVNVERALARAGEGYPLLRAEAEASAGALEIERGTYAEAIARLEAAAGLFADRGDNEARLRCSVYLGEAYRLSGDLLAARRCFERFAPDELDPNFRALAAQARLGLGLVEWQEGEPGEARTLFQDALESARALGDASLRASAAGNLGVLACQEGDLATALARYEEARRTNAELGEIESEVIVNNNLGILHLKKHSWTEGIACFSRVLRLSGEIGNDRWKTLALCGLSDAWRGNGDISLAVEYARKAIITAEYFDPSLERGVCERVYGDALFALGDLSDARDCFARAIPLLDAARDYEDLVAAKEGLKKSDMALNGLGIGGLR